jgi:hypothetical protein
MNAVSKEPPSFSFNQLHLTVSRQPSLNNAGTKVAHPNDEPRLSWAGLLQSTISQLLDQIVVAMKSVCTSISSKYAPPT